MIETKVEAFLERHSFTLNNKRIVVGVSGGPDSLALLYYLLGKKQTNNLFIVVAHIDHMFRGEESFSDAMFVKDFCSICNIPFEMVQVDVQDLMARTGKSAEIAAREVRYDFFSKIMEQYQCTHLALAHHGDDQVETVLMRLTRGSTGKARAGIPFQRPFQSGFIFRPFLSVTKEEITHYCEQKHLIPRIDSSNEENIYTRNRFRHKILPFLKEENPHVHEHFQRFSEELQSDEEYLQELAVQRMNKVMTLRKTDHITIDVNQFREMPKPLQRRGIQLILNYLYKQRPESLSATHIDQIIALLNESYPSGKLDLPARLKVIRSYLSCHFQFDLISSQPYRFDLSDQGTLYLPGGGEVTFTYVHDPTPQRTEYTALFHEHLVHMPLIVRTRIAGDRMSLKGIKGSKKLKDIFIDRKIPVQQRDTWPVIMDQEGRIIWLPGLKKSAIEGIGHATGRFIQLTYSRNDF